MKSKTSRKFISRHKGHVFKHTNRQMHTRDGSRGTKEKRTPVLRFFMGRLEPVSDWPQQLMAKFKKDFGDSL